MFYFEILFYFFIVWRNKKTLIFEKSSVNNDFVAYHPDEK